MIERLVVEEDVRTAMRRIVGVELLLEGTCGMMPRVLRTGLRDTPAKRKREDGPKEEVKKKKV